MKKKPKQKTPRSQPPRATAAEVERAEDRRAEATTVAWTLCGLAAMAGDLGSLLLNGLLRGAANGPLAILPNVLLLIAALSGIIALALTPLVYRFRRIPPPPQITVVIVLAALAPWLVWVVGGGG